MQLNPISAPVAVALLAASALVLSGCSGKPARIDPPDVDADAAGRAAVAQYDDNGDGTIDTAELEASPALEAAAPKIDTDGDGALTGEEIAARIQTWLDSGLGMTMYGCQVSLDGKPLADATVTLEPEPFLGEAVHPASGVTDASGIAQLSVAEQHRPEPTLLGVTSGFYSVRVTRDGSGTPIPAQYNSATTLGCEVGSDFAGADPSGLQLQLTSEGGR